MAVGYPYKIVENYIYIYQLDKYILIPVYPESIQDTLGSTFASENILARTAPIFSYSYSGPRSIQFTMSLHRDLMNSFNWENGNFDWQDERAVELGEDYVDTLVRYVQAMGLPSYSAVSIQDASNKMINPPMAAVRFGNEVFIKGIVKDTVGVTYEGPINTDGKYTQVTISFTITEVEPQDADSVYQNGSMRPLSNMLR